MRWGPNNLPAALVATSAATESQLRGEASNQSIYRVRPNIGLRAHFAQLVRLRKTLRRQGAQIRLYPPAFRPQHVLEQQSQDSQSSQFDCRVGLADVTPCRAEGL